MLLYGKPVADSVLEGIGAEIKAGVRPKLGIVLVGEDPASQIYVRNKLESAKKIGMEAELFHLPRSAKEGEVLSLVDRLNRDMQIDGFIVQLPLPAHINADRVLGAIRPEKDVDGLHPLNMGRVLLNLDEGFSPATPSGIMMLLEHYKVKIAGANAVVVGRSSIVGKPVAAMLLSRDATVSVCHSKTKNLSDYTKNADILVVAAGKPGLIKPGMVKDGAYVVDAGTSRVNGKTVGDVDPAVQKKAHLSPVPGGVGLLTVALLLQNTLKAAKMRKSANKG